jgi:hypothetical protein
MDFLLRKSGGLIALFAKDYELLHNGTVCCLLGFYNWKYVEYSIDGNRYVIRSDGKGKWVLEQSEINIACCKRHASGPKLEFSIDFEDRVWCFKPIRKKLVLTHEIWEEKLKIGQITPHIRFWSTEVGATFEQVPRLEVAVFAVWVMGIHLGGVAGKLTAGRAEIGI